MEGGKEKHFVCQFPSGYNTRKIKSLEKGTFYVHMNEVSLSGIKSKRL